MAIHGFGRPVGNSFYGDDSTDAANYEEILYDIKVKMGNARNAPQVPSYYDSAEARKKYSGKGTMAYNPITKEFDDRQGIITCLVLSENNSVWEGLALKLEKSGWVYGVSEKDIILG
jgi:hypothetical protein